MSCFRVLYILFLLSIFSYGCVNVGNKKVPVDSVLVKHAVVFEISDNPEVSKNIGTRSLGNAKSGEILNDSFLISNVGEKIAVILEAKTNCGCVELSYDKKPMKTGEKNLVKYSYDTKGKTGTQFSEITIKTNIGTYTVLVDLNIE